MHVYFRARHLQTAWLSSTIDISLADDAFIHLGPFQNLPRVLQSSSRAPQERWTASLGPGAVTDMWSVKMKAMSTTAPCARTTSFSATASNAWNSHCAATEKSTARTAQTKTSAMVRLVFLNHRLLLHLILDQLKVQYKLLHLFLWHI